MKNLSTLSLLHKYKSEWLLTILVVANIVTLIFFALSRSIDISTFHLDGAFQTASALYRLADGQWPGKDFYPYLGIGVTYCVYPLFKLMGSNMAASAFSAYLIVTLSCLFSIGLITVLTFRRNRLWAGLITSSLYLCFMCFNYPDLPEEVFERFTPGNSLRPLRAFIPYLSTAIIYLLFYLRVKPFSLYSAIGAIAGLAFLWSNDLGIPTAGLLIAFGFFWSWRTGILSLKLAASIIVAFILSAFLGLMVMTHGHPLELIKYNFKDVAHDQYWYFAPWTQNFRILSLGEFFPKIFGDLGWWGLVYIFAAMFICMLPSLENVLLLMIGIAVLGGAVVATVGGHRGYMAAPIFWCQVTGLVYVLAWSSEYLATASFFKTFRACLKKTTYIFIGVVFVIVFGTLWHVANDYEVRKAYAKIDRSRFYVEELGGYLPIQWKDYVTFIRIHAKDTVIEEFWGLWSSITHQHPPYPIPVDAVIHALGEVRSTYPEVLRSLPDFIVTTPRYMSTNWQPYLMSVNWDFYKIILQNYTPELTSPTTLLWHKSKPVTWPEVGCAVTNGDKPFVVLSTNEPGYYDITLQYKDTGLHKPSIVMVRNNLNYAADGKGFVPLNPDATSTSFISVITDDRDNKFDFKFISHSGNLIPFHLNGCQAKKVLFSHLDVLPSSDISGADRAYDVTTENWYRGWARRGWTGFFVAASKANLHGLSPGKKLRFADGSVRKIIKQDPAGDNVYIVLEGNSMNLVRVSSEPFQVIP